MYDNVNFEENLDEFIEEWQNTQFKVITIYDKILKWRMVVFVTFLLSVLSYFNRLLLPNLFILEQKISLISNLFLYAGIIFTMIFGVLLLRFEKNLAKYELDKPKEGEELNKLIKKVLKRKN